MAVNYKTSGVDVEAGDQLVDWLSLDRGNAKLQFSKNLISGIGGFASLFRMNFPEIKKPVLVTCTDGVGTKVKLASQVGKFDSVGQDLVAMCVNDLVCTGGFPLLFLDYYAVGKLDLQQAKEFLSGVKSACAQAKCLLVGGETAEMPGVYQSNDFDCAGFAVGLVDEDSILGAHRVKPKDCVLGVSSSGFHSNGYSLLRNVFSEDLSKWADQLLVPTHLYVDLALELARLGPSLHALAHVTGGGIDNVPRVLPKDLTWEMKPWPWPEIFKEVQKRTKMTDQEMLTTLNCGVGMVVIADLQARDEALKIIKNCGFSAFDLGQVSEG